MVKLEKNEYASYYEPYIRTLLDDDKSAIEYLEDSIVQFENVLGNIPADKHLYQYAEGKWTIKEVIQHLIDTERVFNYRAVRFARKDSTALPGFDENHFVAQSYANQRDYKDLVKEFIALRKSTVLLYQSFSDEVIKYQGAASGSAMSVRALAYITSGHLLHHLQVVQNRYL